MKPLLIANKITRYQHECIDIFDLDTGVKTINNFVGKVEALSHQYQKDQEEVNPFKGDMLEILSEIFFRIFYADTSVGIMNYTPIDISEDYGVDAIGTNVNDDKCVIQVKYRDNPLGIITYEELSKTYTAGREFHKLSLDNNDTILLFTTGHSVSASCDIIFKKKLRVINRSIIAGKIDNNQNFWTEAESLIIKTFDDLDKN